MDNEEGPTAQPRTSVQCYVAAWTGGELGENAAKSLQSCPTLCDPTDGSPSGFPVPGILQAGILEWVAISFSSHRPTYKQVLPCTQLMSQDCGPIRSQG